MTQPPMEGEEEVFDATPYLKLVIDKEGKWFQNGAEIIHREIYLHFNRMLEKTPDGGYQVRLGREICRVDVEDAPFVVQRVTERNREGLVIELNDGTEEPFHPDRFWIGDENVPYVYVKSRAFHARFSRPAYYQLAKNVASDDDGATFHFVIKGKPTPIKVAHDNLQSR